MNVIKNWMSHLAVALLVLFFTTSLVQADALDDLIDSYSFDYDSGEVDVGGVTDSLTGDVFSFDVDVVSADSGDYVFYIDIEDAGEIVSGSSAVYLNSVGGIVRVNIGSYFLSGIKQFNYSLRVYDSKDSLVYWKGGFVSKIYSDYDSGFEILNIEDFNVGNDSVVFNVSLSSSVDDVENVSVFLFPRGDSGEPEYGDEVVILTREVEFEVGVNYAVFELDGEVIAAGHYDGFYEVGKILIGERLLVFDYNSSSYNFEDFIERSYLSGVESFFVDLDDDDLIDYLEIDFEIDVREAGEYFVGGYVYDLNGQYLMTVIGEEDLDVGDESISVRVNGSLIYSLGIDGPYVFSFAFLFFEEEEVDFVENVSICGEVSYRDFERPALSDLEVVIEGQNVSVKNIGEVDAFSVVVKVFNNSEEKKFVLNELGVGEEYFFVVDFNESFVVVADLDNFIDEENESNNFAVYSASSEEAEDVFYLETRLISPLNDSSYSEGDLIFSCEYNGSEEISNVVFYGDFDGDWKVVENKNVNENYGVVSFEVDLAEGDYVWNCEALDVNGESSFYFENYSLEIYDDSDDRSSSSRTKSFTRHEVKEVAELVEDKSFGDKGIFLGNAQYTEDEEEGGLLIAGLSFVFVILFFSLTLALKSKKGI